MIARVLAIAGTLFLGAAELAAQSLPIVFVHGNGDSAALWHTTIWRFESQGYDPQRLFAVDMAAPTAPGDDTDVISRVFACGAVVQSIKRTGKAAARKRPFGAGLADNAGDL